MKNIYFVQANISCQSVRSYLPYAVGCLISYAWQFPEISREYHVADIFFRREKVDEILSKIDNPYLVALSCNTWNIEYNKALAARIKKSYPGCMILFGGHSVVDDSKLSYECDSVDFFIYGEGEEPFYQLLRALSCEAGVAGVENLVYKKNGEVKINRGFHDRIIEQYPSPYLTGVFDRLIAENPEVDFNITMETNRGCPYGCAFCDWTCSEKVRCFSMERIKGEIDWMAEHKITYCMPGDANFGILPRDVEIAKYLIQVREKTGYPEIFKPCYAKNSSDNVFTAGCLLNSCGADKGVTVSCQSMSPEVLKNINRSNSSIEQYKSMVSRFKAVGIPTYTELIVGLPGETYDSFCRGVCETMECGQHNSLSVYMCNVYPGSPLNRKEYRESFGIETTHIPLNTAHYLPDFNGVQEYYDVVVQTSAMPLQDWVRANIFASVVQCFHHMGLLRCFSVYLRREHKISYFDFYTSLMSYFEANESTVAGKYFRHVREKLSDVENADWTYQDDRFSKIGWFFDEGAFLEFVYAGGLFWAEIEPFLAAFGIESSVFEELFAYQRQIIRLPGSEGTQVVSEYDFFSYFEQDEGGEERLLKRKTRLSIIFEKPVANWKDYSREIIWFGKRRSATLVTNPRERIEHVYE